LKKAIPLLVPVIVILAHSAASAAGLAPLNALETNVLSWASAISVIAFIAVCLTMALAHDHITAMLGSMTRVVVACALAVTAAPFLAGLGVNAATGAWLR
jgi:hypothetical protein